MNYQFGIWIINLLFRIIQRYALLVRCVELSIRLNENIIQYFIFINSLFQMINMIYQNN